MFCCARTSTRWVQGRKAQLLNSQDVYGVRAAPRSFFVSKITRSGYPPVGKVMEYYGADIRRYKFHRLARSGYPPLNMSRSGGDFFHVCYGVERSGYPPLQMSRIIAERISVARFFSRSGLSHSVEQTAQNHAISHGAP